MLELRKDGMTTNSPNRPSIRTPNLPFKPSLGTKKVRPISQQNNVGTVGGKSHVGRGDKLPWPVPAGPFCLPSQH